MKPLSRTDPLARAAIRTRQGAILLPALGRAVRWQPIVLAGLFAAVLITIMKHSPDGFDLLAAIRLSEVLLACGAAFLLDDAAAIVIATAPAPLPYRRGLRLGFGGAVLALTWCSLVWYATGTPRAVWGGTVNGLPFPIARFSTELATLASLALGAAVIAGRRAGDQRGGLAGGPVVLVALLALSKLPARWSMLVGPGAPRWDDSHRDWTLVLACTVLARVALSLDPARSTVRARVHRRATAVRAP